MDVFVRSRLSPRPMSSEASRSALVGTIHALQRVLRLAQTPDAQLEALSMEELNRLAVELEKQAFEQR